MKLPSELRGGLLLALNTFVILALAFPVQILVARYLGPEELGQYAYILSFWVIARMFVNLNLQDVIIPLTGEARFSESKETLYSTGWLLSKMASGFLLLLTCLVAVALQVQDNSRALSVTWRILIVVVATVFSDHQIYSIWCKCEGKLWDFVKTDLGGTLVGLATRLVIVSMGGSINALLASYILEQFAKLCIAVVLYKTERREFFKLRTYNYQTAKTICTSVWPIWLSALLTIAYARFDQILLGQMLSSTNQLGHYSVAVRLVEALTAGAVALFIVYLPILSRTEDQAFHENLQRLQDLMVWGCLLLFCPMYFGLKPLVIALYGERFIQAGELAEIYLLGLPALCLSLSRPAYMYTRGHQKLELMLKVLGVGANIALNLIFIPKYGALGAVWAIVGVQWVVSVLLSFLLPPLHPVAGATSKALVLPASFLRLLTWIRRRNQATKAPIHDK